MRCGIEWRPLRPSRCAPLLSKCKWGGAGQPEERHAWGDSVARADTCCAGATATASLPTGFPSFAVPSQAGPTVAALLAEHPADVLRTLQKSGVQKVAEFQVEVR